MSKENKKCFVKKLKNCSCDFTNHFKKLIIIPAVLLLAALVLVFTVGFNRSVEFTGGTAVRVFKPETTSVATMQQKINNVLSNNGLTASVFQQVEFEGKEYVSVKYKNRQNLSEQRITEINEKVVDELFVEFGFNPNNSEQEHNVIGNERFSPYVAKQAMVNTFLIIVLASVLMVVYFVFRFSHQMAMTALVSIYHDILIAISLTLIFRVKITLTFMSGLLFVLAFSMLNNLLYFSTLKQNIKQAEKTTTAQQLATNSLKQHLKTQITIALAATIALTIFVLFGLHSTFAVGMTSIFGVLASLFSLTFLAPTLWKTIYVPHKKKVKKVEAKA